MKALLVFFLTLGSCIVFAEPSPEQLHCFIHDGNSIDLTESKGVFKLRVHKACGLEVARALKLPAVGSYWRDSTAAVEFKSCSFSVDGVRRFSCGNTLVPVAIGWPTYEDVFAIVSVSGIESEDGLLVSLRIQDEARDLDVMDRFRFRKSDCYQERFAEAAQNPNVLKTMEAEVGFSCTPKCISGVPYCCLRDDQCFRQQGKC